MSLTSPSPVAPDSPETAPEHFPYGWRIVEQQAADGTPIVAYLPLTLEDVLHPQEGDQVTHTEAHERRCVYLYDVFRAQLAADPTAVVLHDVRIAWDVPGLKPHGPDLMVIRGVRARRNWSTFNVAEEGVRPALIVEVTSPETARVDHADKLDEYDQAGLPLYVIVDSSCQGGQERLRLFGYQRVAGRFQGLSPDERGRLWLPPVGVWLGIAENELVCYDKTDAPIGDYTSQVAARLAAEARAAALDARLQQIEAELRRLRGEA